MLVSRALLLQLFRLLPKQSEEEKRVAIITRKLNNISSMNSWRTNGRHEFVKGLIAASKKRKEAGHEQFAGRTMHSVAQHWFSRHAALWASQSLQRKAGWNKRACAASVRKDAALKEAEEALIAELEVLTSRSANVTLDDVGPLSMSAASLTTEDLATVDELLGNEGFASMVNISMLREKAFHTPKPWSDAIMEKFAKHTVWSRPQLPCPTWAKPIVHTRGFSAMPS